MSKMPAWLDEHMETTDTVEPYARYFVYGPFGSGKTRFISTAPEALILDVDRGTKTLRGKNIEGRKVHVLQPEIIKNKRLAAGERSVTTFKVIREIAELARAKEGPFAAGGKYAGVKTIALDGYTALGRIYKNEMMQIKGKNPLLEKADYDIWNSLKEMLFATTFELKNLPYHVIFTALSKVYTSEDEGDILGLPQIDGSFRDEVGGLFDEVYFMDTMTRGGKLNYMTYTARHKHWGAKSRRQVPSPLPPVMESPTFADVWEGEYDAKGEAVR